MPSKGGQSSSMDREKLWRSLLHTIEVTVAGGLVGFIVYLFRDDQDVMRAVKDAVLVTIPVSVGAFGAKLYREVSGKDYINAKK